MVTDTCNEAHSYVKNLVRDNRDDIEAQAAEIADRRIEDARPELSTLVCMAAGSGYAIRSFLEESRIDCDSDDELGLLCIPSFVNAFSQRCQELLSEA